MMLISHIPNLLNGYIFFPLAPEEKDEVGEWRLQSLKKKHEESRDLGTQLAQASTVERCQEKERIKQELIDAGEDVPWTRREVNGWERNFAG